MGWNELSKNLTAYRVYDLDQDNVIELNVPPQYWPSDWSAPEQRLLVTIREGEHANGLAWINVDGSGDPEYLILAGENEAAWDFRVAPDGLRILCQMGPKGPPWDATQGRLTVVDLAGGKRVQIDEPGQTYGCCWSPNGARIAYTWQPMLDHPEQVNEREIQLITCDPDGSNRKVVTQRKYTIPPNSSAIAGYPIFFSVLDWR
jgi:hypothetical protein